MTGLSEARMENLLDRLSRRLPDASDDALLEDLLAEAAAFVCAYTRRDAVPEGLDDVLVYIAAVLFNRMGMEGEVSHGEGGVTRTVEMLPEDVKRWLGGWRIAKTM